MTAYDAAGALVTLLVNNVSLINTSLSQTTYNLSTAAGIAGADTSAYRYIKVGDRDILPDNALTICVVPVSMDPTGEETCNGIIYEAKCTIMAYFTGTADPAGRELARAAVGDAVRSLLNSIPQRIVTPLGSSNSFHDCRVNAMQFGYSARMGEAKMGQVAAGVRLEWRGLYYITEGASNG